MNRPLDPANPPWTPVDPSPRLSAVADAIARLDAAAQAATPRGRYSHDALVAAATEICRAAHERGLQIEQVLIAVKDAWHATPGRTPRRPGVPEEGLDQLITLCIREYYAARGD